MPDVREFLTLILSVMGGARSLYAPLFATPPVTEMFA